MRVIIILMLILPSTIAYSKDKPVTVDRYDVRKLQNDPSVLISARKPMIESRFSKRYEEQVIKVQAEQKERGNEDVKISATIESDDYPNPVPYEL